MAFGKHFECMYEGSMVGAGPVVFAIMGYVIAKTRKSKVELNPALLCGVFGCSEQQVEEGIKYLASPDKKSRNQDHQGKRLVHQGGYEYLVPSWAFYRAMGSEDDRREYNAMKQREYRARKRPKNSNSPTFIERLDEKQAREGAD